MLCGLGAGVAEATFVVTWVETLKVLNWNSVFHLIKIWQIISFNLIQVRLIADQRRKNPTYRGLFHCATSILKEEVSRKIGRKKNLVMFLCFRVFPDYTEVLDQQSWSRDLTKQSDFSSWSLSEISTPTEKCRRMFHIIWRLYLDP